jgi:hypothetical protein
MRIQSLSGTPMTESGSQPPSADPERAVVPEPAEEAILAQLSPDVARYVRSRLEQERLSIDCERERLIHAMNDEIRHIKQRRLYEICGQMRELSLRDSENRGAYEEIYPELFCGLGPKPARPKARRKTRDSKAAMDLAVMSRPIPKADVLMDLNGGARLKPVAQPVPRGTALMATKNGQRWIVRRSDAGDGLVKLTYCDGSSSVMTAADAETLGLRFSTIPDMHAKI